MSNLPNEAEMLLERFTLSALKSYIDSGFAKFAPTTQFDSWLKLDMGFLRISIYGNTADIYSIGETWKVIKNIYDDNPVVIRKTETFEMIKTFISCGIDHQVESWFAQTYDCAA